MDRPDVIWFESPAPKPPPPERPNSGISHGACLASSGGAIVTAEKRDGITTALRLQRFPTSLAPIATELLRLVLDDPGCYAIVDRSLRGRELLDYLDLRKLPLLDRRRFEIFDAVAEDRRYEIAGRLTHGLEVGKVKLRRSLLDPSLRQALNAATREDAGERPEVVALSLAVIDRRPVPPRVF